MLFQTSLGIDIRHDSMAVLFLKSSFRGVSVGAHSAYSFEENLPVKEKTGVIHNFIREFMTENRIGSANIYIGLPEDSALFRETDFPLAVKENLSSTLSYEIDKYAPLTSDQVCFDYQILSESRETGRIKLLLGIAKKEVISQYIELAKALQKNVSGIETVATARVNYMSLIHSDDKTFPENASRLLLSEKDSGLSDPAEAVSALNRFGVPSADLAPAFGLALKGIRNVPLQINFLPPEMRKKPGRGVYYAMLILTVLMLITGAAWISSHILHQRLVRNRLDIAMEQLSPEVRRIDQMRGDAENLDANLAFFRNFYSQKNSAVGILNELSRILPDAAWVYEFSLSDNAIQLNGFAVSASELISVLEDSPFFKDAGFLSSINKTGDGKEQFSIGMKIE